MLPQHNIPSVVHHGAKRLHPNECSQNFGTFLGGTFQDNNGLAIVDYKAIKGHDSKPLGLGVKTEV